MLPPETDEVKNFCTFGSPPAIVKVNEMACGANTGPGGAAIVTVGHGDSVGTDGGGTGTACERAAIAKTATNKAAATKIATVFFIFRGTLPVIRKVTENIPFRGHSWQENRSLDVDGLGMIYIFIDAKSGS